MLQNLGISQKRRSRFNPIEAASYQEIGAMQKGLEIGMPMQGKTKFGNTSGIYTS
ncbi:MAG: hypothetical protein KDK96_01120 [Chlamydiia bacterium]|nr:hypothetical protein [Chlamydiia bacterium]